MLMLHAEDDRTVPLDLARKVCLFLCLLVIENVCVFACVCIYIYNGCASIIHMHVFVHLLIMCLLADARVCDVVFAYLCVHVYMYVLRI